MAYITEERNDPSDYVLAGWLLTAHGDCLDPAGVCSTYDRHQLVSVEIAALRVFPGFLRKGHGTMLMNRALELYDREPREITLTVVPYHAEHGGMNREQLFEWYARFGFARDTGYSQNRMVREARCPTKTLV